MTYTSEDASFRARLLSDLGFAEDPRWSITELLKRHRTQVLTKEGLGIPALDTRLDTLESGVGFLSPSGSDDTAAIVTAFDTYKVVILDEGTFLSTGFTVPTGRILSGVGTLSIIDTTGTISLSNNSQIRDLVIDGGPALTYLLDTSAGSVVENCTLKNGNGYGIHATSGDVDVVIRNNIFKDIPSYALIAEGSVTRLVFEGNTITNSTSGQGVTVKTNSGSPVDTRINNNTVNVQGIIGIEYQISGVTRGTINGNVVRGPSIGISLSSADGVTVSGNTVSSCGTYGIEVAQASTNSNITGNTVLDCGTGIIVSSPSASPESSNILVGNNVVKNASTYGIQLEFGHNISVIDNTIHEPTSRAIFLNNSPDKCLVSNNKIYRLTTSADGIYTTGNYNKISDNLIDKLSAPVGNWGINHNGGDAVYITNNYILGTHSKGIGLVGGTNHTLIGNVVRGTSQHSMYTSGVGYLYIDAHVAAYSGGVGLDFAGVTSYSAGTHIQNNVIYFSGSRLNSPTLGFYGVTPVSRPTAPTAADAGVVNSGDATTDAVINNMRTRIGELETKLRLLGLIT